MFIGESQLDITAQGAEDGFGLIGANSASAAANIISRGKLLT
jgi:hypothetical protein